MPEQDCSTADEAAFSDAVEQWICEASYHAAFAKAQCLARDQVRSTYEAGSRRFRLLWPPPG